MSHYMSSDDQSEFLSHTSDWEDVFGEDHFTAGRPPQYNNTNQPSSLPILASGTDAVPRTLSDAELEYALAEIHNHYAQSWHTSSSVTVTPGQAAATAASAVMSIPLRGHIDFYVNHNYDNTTPQLTESAVAALNNETAVSSYLGIVAEWIGGAPQHTPHGDLPRVDISMLGDPRTESMPCSASTVGSSWTVVSKSAQLHGHASAQEHNVCAAGLQFLDVAAPRAGPLIIDEDRE